MRLTLNWSAEDVKASFSRPHGICVKRDYVAQRMTGLPIPAHVATSEDEWESISAARGEGIISIVPRFARAPF